MTLCPVVGLGPILGHSALLMEPRNTRCGPCLLRWLRGIKHWLRNNYILAFIQTAIVNNAKFQKQLHTFISLVQPTILNASNLSGPWHL